MIKLSTVQIIIEIVIFIVLLYVAFLKSYFNEKGKNLATKEDIEEITAKVESIKSQLHYALQAKLNFRAEEHAALTDYYSKCYSWFSGILNCNYSDIFHDNAHQLGEVRRNLEYLEHEFSLAEGKMELFVDNSDIVARSGQLKMEMLKLQSHATQAGFQLEKLFLDMTTMFSKTPLADQASAYKPLLTQQQEIYKKFREEQIELCKDLWPLIHMQRSAISEYLRSLMEQ